MMVKKTNFYIPFYLFSDLAPEDAANENGDGNGSEFEPVVDACPNCEAFRANTAQAWKILRDLHQNEKELADVEKVRQLLFVF